MAIDWKKYEKEFEGLDADEISAIKVRVVANEIRDKETEAKVPEKKKRGLF